MDKPFVDHKIGSLQMGEIFARLGKVAIADKMLECGSWLKYDECPSGHEKNLKRANFCKARLCPTCMWRRSLKIYGQVLQVAEMTARIHKVKWVFLTLTVRNCNVDDLHNTIDHLMQGFNKLNQRKVFKKHAYGWFRSLEVTRNNEPIKKDFGENEWYDTYHPHYHVLIAMKPSYFKGGNYLSQQEWSKLWQKCLGVDYEPRIDIRLVKNKRNKEEEQRIMNEKGFTRDYNGQLTQLPPSAVAEVSKYTAKTKDMITDYNPITKTEIPLTNWEKDHIILNLYRTLSRRRLYAFGGLLKELHKVLSLDDVDSESADLVGHEEQCKCSVCNTDMIETLYSWIPSKSNYYKIEREEQQEKIISRHEDMTKGLFKTKRKLTDLDKMIYVHKMKQAEKKEPSKEKKVAKKKLSDK